MEKRRKKKIWAWIWAILICILAFQPPDIAQAETKEEEIFFDSGEDAKVIDTHTNYNHILDFEIPKGDMGPTGPTGPNPRVFYAHKFNDEGITINLKTGISQHIALNRTGFYDGINISEEDVMVITETGIYKIDFFII